MDLGRIEPFTVVVLEKNNLYECRWDGYEKYYKQLKKHRPYIWSSVTLYDNDAIRKRELPWTEPQTKNLRNRCGI